MKQRRTPGFQGEAKELRKSWNYLGREAWDLGSLPCSRTIEAQSHPLLPERVWTCTQLGPAPEEYLFRIVTRSLFFTDVRVNFASGE